MSRFRAFLSCHLPANNEVKSIANMLEREFEPYICDEPQPGQLPEILTNKIRECDCLIVVALDSDSAFIQNEIGTALALGKPVAAIIREGVQLGGILRYLCTSITYVTLEDCLARIPSLKDNLIAKLTSGFSIRGGPQGFLASADELGLLGVYHSRAAAFQDFFRFWKQGTDIAIVASTLEGFRKGLGLDPRELLGEKLRSRARIRILLTHPDFISYREQQEGTAKGSIKKELKRCHKELFTIRDIHAAEERLTWRFFRGAPTCFMIATDEFMLLNPYLYMQPALFNFSLVARNTGSELDIYGRYMRHHFEAAWNHPSLSLRKQELKKK